MFTCLYYSMEHRPEQHCIKACKPNTCIYIFIIWIQYFSSLKYIINTNWNQSLYAVEILGRTKSKLSNWIHQHV